jgi:hypothetical protein
VEKAFDDRPIGGMGEQFGAAAEVRDVIATEDERGVWNVVL